MQTGQPCKVWASWTKLARSLNIHKFSLEAGNSCKCTSQLTMKEEQKALSCRSQERALCRALPFAHCVGECNPAQCPQRQKSPFLCPPQHTSGVPKYFPLLSGRSVSLTGHAIGTKACSCPGVDSGRHWGTHTTWVGRETSFSAEAQRSISWGCPSSAIRRCLLCCFLAGCAGGHCGKGGLWEELAAGRHHWGAPQVMNVQCIPDFGFTP